MEILKNSTKYTVKKYFDIQIKLENKKILLVSGENLEKLGICKLKFSGHPGKKNILLSSLKMKSRSRFEFMSWSILMKDDKGFILIIQQNI